MNTCPVCGKHNEDTAVSCQFCGTRLTNFGLSEELKIPKIEPGNVLAGRYRILTKVGKGGMGHVYAAEEESLGISRHVAIKILPPQMMLDEGLAARFREEIKIAAALDHPNIVPIYSLGEHHGVYFYVMKLLDGMTAFQRLRQQGPFSELEVREIIPPIARALNYAHSKGVIHRDVKSNNIHIGKDNSVMLMDFGIARSADSSEITLPGQIVGTAEYMAPEQWYGEAGVGSDIYSLGVVCYELICGKVPFKSKNTFELMKMHQEVPPEPLRPIAPYLSEDLERIIFKCLAKEKADRYASALDLAVALEAKPVEKAEAEKVAEQPAQEADTEVSTLRTSVMEKPPEELSETDRKAWDLCQKADDLYAHGQLDKAIATVQKALKLAPERPDVISRQKKYENLKALIERTIKRADQALKDTLPQQAVNDYERVLQSYPIPEVAAKLARARTQMEEAKQFYNRARLLESRGKRKQALKLIKKLEKLDREVGDLKTRRMMLSNRSRPRRKRKSKLTNVINGPRIIVFLLLLAIVGLVFGARPALYYVADHQYQQDTNKSLFLSSSSALKIYETIKSLRISNILVEERIAEIKLRAKKHYVNLGDKMMKEKNLGKAIEYYRKALDMDPVDPDLRDVVGMLEAKFAVKKSLGNL